MWNYYDVCKHYWIMDGWFWMEECLRHKCTLLKIPKVSPNILSALFAIPNTSTVLHIKKIINNNVCMCVPCNSLNQIMGKFPSSVHIVLKTLIYLGLCFEKAFSMFKFLIWLQIPYKYRFYYTIIDRWIWQWRK